MAKANKILAAVFIILFLIILGEGGYYFFNKPRNKIGNTGENNRTYQFVASEHEQFLNDFLERVKETTVGKAHIVFEGTGILKNLKFFDNGYYSFSIFNHQNEKLFGEIIRLDDKTVVFYNTDKKNILPTEVKNIKNDNKVNFVFKYNMISKMIDGVEIFLN